MKIYTGIGSRSTPEPILNAMTQIAQALNPRGWVLRSGHADGADKAFEEGAKFKEIYLPWAGFNRSAPGQLTHTVVEWSPELERVASSFHPNWPACSSGARKLHMRNVCQILGADLKTPTDLVICWTPQGSGSGGTGQAIRIAHGHSIPVFDLALREHQESLLEFLDLREAA